MGIELIPREADKKWPSLTPCQISRHAMQQVRVSSEEFK